MLSLRKGFKIGLLFIKRNFVLIIIGFFLGGGFFFARKKLFSFYHTLFPPTLEIGVVGKYTLKTLPQEIGSLISIGLTTLSTNGSPLPGAALSWQIENQGKRYIFYLNPHLRWHDGTPLKAKDINYQIKGVKISPTDPKTVVFDLDEPFSPLPVLVSKPLFKRGKLGLGKYRIKRIKMNAGYISQLVLIKKDKSQKISFRFYPNQKALIDGFKLGEVDLILGLTNIDEFRKWKNVFVVPRQEINKKYVALFFNTQKDPFQDKKFRQVLSYAIKKPSRSNRALTPISPLSWAYNKNVKTYPFDPVHAKNILENTKVKDIRQIKIKIMTNKELVNWAEQIKGDWEKFLGIKAEVQVVPIFSNTEDFDVILGYGPILPDPDQYFLWHSKQPGNITHYSNPRIDKLLEKGRQSFSKEERKEIYQDFQRFLVEDVPALFLFFPESYQVSRGEKLPPDLNL